MSKITNSFLVVSNYESDISWVPEYTDNYVIYNKKGEVADNIDPKKVIDQTGFGQGMYDYLSYIVDNYDTMPPLVQFVKGNIFPRILSQNAYDKICNNNYFTPIEDYGEHEVKYPKSCLSCDGGYLEYNDSWYLSELPHRYFHSYNDFLRFVYDDPILPVFVRFPPGGCFIVHREQIRKLPKKLYENLKKYLIYTANPAEAHMMERSIYTWWTSMMKPNKLHLLDEKEEPQARLRKATPEDSRFLLICHNLCREGFFDTKEITKEEHEEWLRNNLPTVYICEVEGNAVGSVRNNKGELHWEILPEHWGNGYGKLFVKKLVDLFPNETLTAEIKPDNTASTNIAIALGFTKLTTFTWQKS